MVSNPSSRAFDDQLHDDQNRTGSRVHSERRSFSPSSRLYVDCHRIDAYCNDTSECHRTMDGAPEKLEHAYSLLLRSRSSSLRHLLIKTKDQ